MTNCYINAKGKTYLLKAKTIETSKRIKEIGELSDSAAKNDLDLEQYVIKSLDFIKYILGADNTKEIIETADDIYSIDINELTVLIMNIIEAYRKPIDEEIMKNNRNKLHNEDVDRVIELYKAVKTAKDLQNDWEND